MTAKESKDTFLEKIGYFENDSILLLMAYGSRITKTEKANSDLDIFIVTKNKRYLSSKIVDGIKVEIHAFPLDEVEREIIYSKITGKSYFKSVLKTGQVIKDDMNLYEELNYLLDEAKNGKRKISQELLDQVENYIYFFKTQKEVYKDTCYFRALELLRRLHHTKENSSNIPPDKVYDLYQNKGLAEEIYCVKLPS